jgi:hypothetical protein
MDAISPLSLLEKNIPLGRLELSKNYKDNAKISCAFMNLTERAEKSENMPSQQLVCR